MEKLANFSLVRVRAAMELSALDNETQEDEKPLPPKETRSTQDILHKLHGNERFQKSVSMYCITPFMSSIARSTHEFGPRPTPQPRTPKLRLTKCKLKQKLKDIKEKVKSWCEKDGNDRGSERSLLFGEVQREKGDLEESKEESVGEGMLWYYGCTGVAPLEGRAELEKVSFLLKRSGVMLTWCSFGGLRGVPKMRKGDSRARETK